MVDESSSGLPRSGRPHRLRIFKLATVFLTLLVSLGSMELIARFAPRKSRSAYAAKWPRKLYVRDDILGKVQRPGVTVTVLDEAGREVIFATDEHGMRIGAGASRSPIGKSVAVLGDSFIQGAATRFEDTFCEALSRCLGGRTVFNLGVGGASTRQAVDLGKRIVPKLDIDTIILAVYAGNDLRDDLWWTGRRPSAKDVEKSVLDHSALYRFIRKSLRLESQSVFQGYDWKSFFDAELLLYDPELSPEDISQLEKAKAKVLANFKELAALASKAGARPMIVFIPSKAMVYREPLFISSTTITPWAWDAMMGVSRRGFDFDRVREIWKSLAEQAQLPFLDLTDDFRASRHESIYGKLDQHWAPSGQQIAAKIVARRLDERAALTAAKAVSGL